MIAVSIIAEFSDDSHSPKWMDGESFTYNGWLTAIPSPDTEISGVLDYDRRSYTVRVVRVAMTMGISRVRIYGMVV